jgi:hypothetical protein
MFYIVLFFYGRLGNWTFNPKKWVRPPYRTPELAVNSFYIQFFYGRLGNRILNPRKWVQPPYWIPVLM